METSASLHSGMFSAPEQHPNTGRSLWTLVIQSWKHQNVESTAIHIPLQEHTEQEMKEEAAVELENRERNQIKCVQEVLTAGGRAGISCAAWKLCSSPIPDSCN
jgi:hypothetical protein